MAWSAERRLFTLEWEAGGGWMWEGGGRGAMLALAPPTEPNGGDWSGGICVCVRDRGRGGYNHVTI